MKRHPPGEVLESFSTLIRGVKAVMAEGYATFDLGTAQAKFIRHIGEHRSISQAALARATTTDPALTGRVLTTLIERGWVRRKRSTDDRREYLLELAPAGKRARERVLEAREHVAKRIAGVLSDRDMDDVARIGEKILLLLEDPKDVR